MKSRIVKTLANIYNLDAITRAVIIWAAFQILMWVVFALAYVTNLNAWVEVPLVDPSTASVGGWTTTFLYILSLNLVLTALIVIGNMFVRFGILTPGLVILIYQGIQIGWMAGSNAFEVPFQTIAASSLQFLQVGFWETGVYAIACAITLPKSLYVAETFPAKEWAEVRQLKDLHFSSSEKLLSVLALVFLVGAAIVEANFLA